jgi:hypothetical protein
MPCSSLSIATPPALATVVRPVLETLPALLPPQSGQPALCPASSALVCAEPSGRGFRRNLCCVVAAAVELAGTLCRLAGAEEARVCRRAVGRDWRVAAASHDTGAFRSTVQTQRNAWRALPEKAGVLRLQATEDVRPQPLPSLLRRSKISKGAASGGLHQAAPRASQAVGRAMDGREPAYARCRP